MTKKLHGLVRSFKVANVLACVAPIVQVHAPIQTLHLLDAIDAGIDNAKTTCSRIIVAGDFNVHNAAWLGSTRTPVAGEAAEDLCYLHGLEQHVQEPHRGRNLLDLIMSDMEGNISTSIHQPLGKPDYATVLADFDQLPLRELPSSRTVWRYQRADWCRLRPFFRQCDWPNIVTMLVMMWTNRALP